MHAAKSDAMDPKEEAAIRILQEAKRHPLPFKKLQKEIARRIEACRTARILSLMATLVDGGMVMEFDLGPSAEYF